MYVEYVCIDVRIIIYAYTYMCIYIERDVCVYIYIYMNNYIHIYIYIYVSSRPGPDSFDDSPWTAIIIAIIITIIRKKYD